MKEQAWFDAVGLTFARNAREVETARTSFLRTRDAFMQELNDLLLGRAKTLGLKVMDRIMKRPEGLDTWAGIQVSGKYQKELSSPYATSLNFCFGHADFWNDGEDIPFGFYTYLYVKMKEAHASRLRLAERLNELVPGATRLRHGGGMITYIVASEHLPGTDSFSPEMIRAAVLSLADHFPRADEMLAEAIRQL